MTDDKQSLTVSSCFQEFSMCCWARRPSWKCWNKQKEHPYDNLVIFIICKAYCCVKHSKCVCVYTHTLSLSFQLLGVSHQLTNHLGAQVFRQFFFLNRKFIQLPKSCSEGQTPGVPSTTRQREDDRDAAIPDKGALLKWTLLIPWLLPELPRCANHQSTLFWGNTAA